MRVLVACEYSGTVRDSFSKLGYDAWSCDIIPTESELTKKENKHIIGDVLEVINDGWDLMIGHPPCNYISYAGTRSWNNPGRVFKRLESLTFFAKLWEAPINHICLENPKSCASPVIAKYSQEIQPYYFGDSFVKTTWLWLKNLPQLKWSSGNTLFETGTACTKPEAQYFESGKRMYCTDILAKGHGNKTRAKERARFWPGIGHAMAEQWGQYVSDQIKIEA